MRLVTATLCVATLLAAPAHAAKPTCNLLTDPANDVRVVVPGAGPQPYVDSAVDIRSLDVTSDAKRLGVTLRMSSVTLASLASTHTDLGAPNIQFYVMLTIASSGRELAFHAQGPADNAFSTVWSAWTFEIGQIRNDAFYAYAAEQFLRQGEAKGAADAATNEIRMSVTWPELKKYGHTKAARGDKATKIRVRVQDWWLSNYKGDALDPGDARYEGAPRDDATTAKSYPLGTPTCTTPVG
jgi:hypothetical protein